MESGTILHLALLKKLAHHYPNGELNDKFYVFKKQNLSFYPRNISRQYQQSDHFEKYNKSRVQKRQNYKTANSLRSKVNKSITKNISYDLINADICGWEIQNEEQHDYSQKIKEKKYNIYGQMQNKLIQVKEALNKKERLPGIFSLRKTQILTQRSFNEIKNTEETKCQRQPLKITYFNSLKDKQNLSPQKLQNKQLKLFRTYKKKILINKRKLSSHLAKENIENYFQ